MEEIESGYWRSNVRSRVKNSDSIVSTRGKAGSQIREGLGIVLYLGREGLDTKNGKMAACWIDGPFFRRKENEDT